MNETTGPLKTHDDMGHEIEWQDWENKEDKQIGVNVDAHEDNYT